MVCQSDREKYGEILEKIVNYDHLNRFDGLNYGGYNNIVTGKNMAEF